jgi:hypothetical protein
MNLMPSNLQFVVESGPPSVPNQLQLLPATVTQMQQQARTINEKMTKEKFVLLIIDDAMDRNDLLALTEKLLISPKSYGHSLTMNGIVKLICRHPMFADQKHKLMNIKKGGTNPTPSTFIGLSHEMKSRNVKYLITTISPVGGPWTEIVAALRKSSLGFDVTQTNNNQKMGVNANRIACITHMLLDERVKAVILTLAQPVIIRVNQPAMLDQYKNTGVSLHQSVYNEIFRNIDDRKNDYANDLVLNHPDLELYNPSAATFNNGAEIKSLISTLASFVAETDRNICS